MIEFIRPQWPAPANVCALSTTRMGGVSADEFASLNLGDHVGDNAAAVTVNRKLLLDACLGLEAISWLEQVHGTAVVEADAQHRQRADAQFTQAEAVACAIMTADCLPVLFCDREGKQVAAAHAGWRGLCGGVLEATVAEFDSPADLLAWFGPAIGPGNFEVGSEVRDQFLAASPSLTARIDTCFTQSAKPRHYFADLYALARLRLLAAGVTSIYGGGLCTFANRGHFYSYRRDGSCGRMATLIYLVANS